MQVKIFGTPMNADVAPIKADECLITRLRWTRPRSNSELSAFIGVTSAFIGVPKIFVSVSH
jgi:hypothetical protein